MSENKPNWAEKANVALNTIQVAQNDQLQRTVGAMGALQAERVRLELNEQKMQEREGQLRELVWKLENSLSELLNNPNLTPCALNILTTQMQDLMARSGVSTAVFRRFEDKDRLGRFINRVEQARRDSSNKMSDRQRADTEAYQLYQSEGPELEELIEELQSESDKTERLLAEAIQQKEAATQAFHHWRHIANDPREQKQNAQQKRRKIMAKTGLWVFAAPTVLAWLVALCFIVIPVFTWATDGFLDLKWSFVGYGIIFWLVAIACTVLCLRLEKKTKPEMSIQEHIVNSEGELKLADAQICTRQLWINTPWESEIFAKFQANDLPELVKRKVERDAFMSQFRQLTGLPQNDLFPRNSIVVLNLSSGRRVTLSPEVQKLARYGEKKMAAIKLYTEESGAGVVEAKEAVEAFIQMENKQKGTI